MKNETDQFVIDQVRWNYIQSGEITGDRMPREPQRAGIRSARVQCKSCGYTWVAIEGNKPGQFKQVATAETVTCPGCGEKGPIQA